MSELSRFGREFPAGCVLFREGETGTEMFVVQTGVIEITKRQGDVERPLATLGRGEFLGEMAILNNKPRTATARVIEDAKLLVIDGKTLEAMLGKNPEIALRLIKKLASRLDAADALVQILLHPDPQARVLLGLKRHAESFGEQVEKGIRLHTTAEAIAREVGADLAQVEDVLTRLRRLKIAVVDPGGASITIADVPRLLEFMEFLEMPRKFDTERPKGEV